jgi:hypothetical protein
VHGFSWGVKNAPILYNLASKQNLIKVGNSALKFIDFIKVRNEHILKKFDQINVNFH